MVKQTEPTVGRAPTEPMSAEVESGMGAYKAAFDSALDGMALIERRTRRVQHINSAFARMLGVERTTAPGLPWTALFHEVADARRANALLDVLDDGGGRARAILRLTRLDGQVRHLSLSVSPVDTPGQNQVLAVVQDVTVSRQAMRSVAEWQMRYSAAVRATGLVLFEWFPQEDTIRIGEHAETLLGRPASALPVHLEDWLLEVHPEDQHRVRAAFERAAREGSPMHIDYRLRRGDGRWLTLRHDAARVAAPDGTTTHMVGFLADVTMQRGLEEQMQQATRMEAVGRLAGGIAHDFNNLLTAIVSYTELAVESVEDPEITDDLNEVLRSSRMAAALTRKLLSFSRRKGVQRRTIDLVHSVEEVQSILNRLIGEDVELITEIDTPEAFIEGDPALIEQCLINLAVNARDAMPQGGVLHVAVTVLEGMKGSAERVELSVSDTGHGIPRDMQDRIFEPFFTTKADGKGTGLGLSIVYEAARRCGGEVMCRSVEGEGTTFTLSFPCVARGLVPQEETRPAEATSAPSARILVVEDEPAVRRLVARVLRNYGHEVVVADGLEAAIEAARARGRLDIIVSDVVMPRASGLEVVAAVHSVRPDLPVMFMSGYPDEVVARHGPLPPDAMFLSKPFDPRRFIEAVHETLGHHRIAASRALEG